MAIRNCVKSMEFLPITFQKQHLAMTDFSDKSLNYKYYKVIYFEEDLIKVTLIVVEKYQIECTDLF